MIGTAVLILPPSLRSPTAACRSPPRCSTCCWVCSWSPIGFRRRRVRPRRRRDAELSWLNPLAFDGFGPFAEAVLLCLFIYWGWDALITVNEETKDKDKTPAGPP